MQTWIALLRGLNVGGKHRLPMAALRDHLEAVGARDIRTFIQSGNAVFSSSVRAARSLPAKVAARIEEHHGFRPEVLVLSPDALRDAVAANPFPEAAEDETSLHLLFLAAKTSNVDTDALDVAKARTERYLLAETVLYLHAPDGIARSKLASKAERLLGVPVTARNLRTVRKLLAIATTD